MEKNQSISDADDNGGRMRVAGTFTNAIYPDPEAGVFLGNSEKLQAHRYHNALSYLDIQSSNKKWRCWLIPLIITVNVLIFAITMGVNNCGKNSSNCTLGFLGRFSFQPLKENPLFGPSSLTLLKMGGLQWSKVVNQGQKWRLLTCIWLHAGVVHLLANMLSLVAIGIRLEQEFGFLKIGLLYLLSGLGGSIMSALFVRHNISVGASGALFGLLGAVLSELLTNWTIYENKVAGLLMLIFFIVLNLAVGILPHVDNFAHIGGFISGFLLGFVVLIRPQFGWINRKKISLEPQINVSVKSKHTHYQYVLWFASLILLISGFVTGLVLLFRGVDLNKHCHWCHYMSCVPTKAWSCKETEVYCMSSQSENQLTLTCQDSGRSKTYPYGNLSESRITSLCVQLCA